MELKKEILIDNKEYVLGKAYPSYVLYCRKQFPNIRTCILWQDIFTDPENYKQDQKGKWCAKW